MVSFHKRQATKIVTLRKDGAIYKLDIIKFTSWESVTGICASGHMLAIFEIQYNCHTQYSTHVTALLGGAQPVIPPNLYYVYEHNSLGSR